MNSSVYTRRSAGVPDESYKDIVSGTVYDKVTGSIPRRILFVAYKTQHIGHGAD